MRDFFSSRSAALGVAVGALLLAAGGCVKTDKPQFHLNVFEMERQAVPPEHQAEIATILEAMFGTPDEPVALAETGLDAKKLRMAAGPVGSDEHGRHQEGLYRQHCVHCHGISGDGLGPTAEMLNPYPRDYRKGLFKFTSTQGGAKPTDADLTHVIREGVVGTAMPSFDLLPQAEIEALVEYVKYLSIRGETEINLANAIKELGDGEHLAQTREYLIEEVLVPKVIERWATAKDAVVEPPAKSQTELAASIDAGRKLFYGSKGNCVKCHGPSALGDGQATDYDDWNKPVVEAQREVDEAPARLEKAREELAKQESLTDKERAERLAELAVEESRIAELAATLHSSVLPPRTIQPRNLRQGIYRGGRRPLDVYRRIHAGIKGTPMPGLGPTTAGATSALTPEEIWQVVDYVQSLPFEEISRPPRERPATPREQL